MKIQDIQKVIVDKYPLTNKMDGSLPCYCIAKRRYIVFWNDVVNKDSVDSILNTLEQETNNLNFSEWKTLIVIGKTNDTFNKTDLVYFNNVNTFVVFYLINEKNDKVFMDDSWIFVLGNNYRKYVRAIHSIVNETKNEQKPPIDGI